MSLATQGFGGAGLATQGFGVSTAPVVEALVDTGGGWLPKEELKKLQKKRKEIETRARLERELKDRQQRELAVELRVIFDKINGIEEAQAEVAEIVAPFVEKLKPLARPVPQVLEIDFKALAAQAELASQLKALAEKIEQRRRDEEDAVALLLLL